MAMLGIVKKHCQRKAANFGGRKPGAGRAEASRFNRYTRASTLIDLAKPVSFLSAAFSS
jgi:hypothetical protein